MDRHTIYLMTGIYVRDYLADVLTLYGELGLEANLVMLGHGTAKAQLLRMIGLNETEKAVVFSPITGDKWLTARKTLIYRLRIEAPGTGIGFIVPMSSVGGKRELMYMTAGQEYEKGEESVLKETEQDLLVAVCNQGYNDLVMDAARDAGAGGGTVIHARGTGMKNAEKYLGITLASEKDMVLIVTAHEKKNEIMKAIMQKAGLETRAKAIVFSLPVTDTVGMQLHPEKEDTEDTADV